MTEKDRLNAMLDALVKVINEYGDVESVLVIGVLESLKLRIAASLVAAAFLSGSCGEEKDGK